MLLGCHLNRPILLLLRLLGLLLPRNLGSSQNLWIRLDQPELALTSPTSLLHHHALRPSDVFACQFLMIWDMFIGMVAVGGVYLLELDGGDRVGLLGLDDLTYKRRVSRSYSKQVGYLQAWDRPSCSRRSCFRFPLV